MGHAGQPALGAGNLGGQHVAPLVARPLAHFGLDAGGVMHLGPRARRLVQLDADAVVPGQAAAAVPFQSGGVQAVTHGGPAHGAGRR